MTSGRIAMAGLTALAVAMGIGRFAFTPILPMMQADAGVSVAAGGWLAAANYVGYLAGALTATRVGLPAPAATRAGVVTIGLATVAMGLTEHGTLWLLLRTVAGIASAWVLIHVSAWSLERLAPARLAASRLAPAQPALGGVVFAGVGVGMALAGVVCVALMSLGARSAHAWGVLGLLALVLGALIWPVFRADGDADTRSRAVVHDAATPWPRDAVRLVLCYGAFGFGYIVPATFVPVMARQAIDDPAVFGWMWPIFGLAAALSPLAAARWSAGNDRRLWIVAQLVMAVGVALPVVVPGMLAIALAACAVGGTFMVITMAGMREARRVAGPAAPGLMAAMTAGFGIGQILGPLCVTATAAVGAGFAPSLLLATLALLASAGALSFTQTPGSLEEKADVVAPD